MLKLNKQVCFGINQTIASVWHQLRSHFLYICKVQYFKNQQSKNSNTLKHQQGSLLFYKYNSHCRISSVCSRELSAQNLSILLLLIASRNLNIIIISMSGTEKNLKKDFSLGQYYSQLQKYQTSSNNKYKTLKKDSSSSSFVKEVTKSVYPSPIYKDVNRTDKPKITIADKYSQPTKLSFDKYDSSKLQNFKKSTKGQEKKYSNYLGESLNNSNISSKKWLTDTNHEEKENIVFGSKEEKTFVQHCTQLYDIKDQSAVVDQIAKAINKRDEVYQQVSQHFKQTDQSKYGQVLQNYFSQHQLLKKIVSEFKAMSRLDIEDLGQLYYFLKTDR